MNVAGLNDDQLMCLLKENNRAAFEEIYRRYWRKLYRIALAKLHSKEIAEELVQDIFVSFWQNRQKIVLYASLAAYLSTAVRYLVFKYFQSNKIRESYRNSLPHYELSENTTEQEIMLQNLMDAYKQGVSDLPERCREVFTLSREENYSVKEIASQLHISEKTVENQITKALKSLRISLKNFTLLISLFLHLPLF